MNTFCRECKRLFSDEEKIAEMKTISLHFTSIPLAYAAPADMNSHDDKLFETFGSEILILTPKRRTVTTEK